MKAFLRSSLLIICLLGFAFLSGCHGCHKKQSNLPKPQLSSGQVAVTWFGQSFFLLQDSSGKRIAIDPFNPEKVGYRDPRIEADIVLSTHDHPDHNYFKIIRGNPTTSNGLLGEEREGNSPVADATVEDLPMRYVDSSHGKLPDGTPIKELNTIFVFELEGIRFCHLGDLGTILDPVQASNTIPVDVLFIPVGGYYTIDANGASQVVQQLNPKLVIPMHYKTPASKIPELSGPEAFLSDKTPFPDSGKHTVIISKDTLPTSTQVLQMAYE